MRRTTSKWLIALAGAAVLAVALAGCGTDSDDGETMRAAPAAPERVRRARPARCWRSSGEMEGEVNILAWPGYAEDGSTDPAVDWVTPFEEETGCQANVKTSAPPTRPSS